MGKLKPILDTNFLEYASYVIKDRAIPHIDDGLKPVQRRILHTLFEMHDGNFHKVANVVGAAMRYHPHGDGSITPALVVIANKNLFIEKQGNFGNMLTGDIAAAGRYIECRLTKLAHQSLHFPEITEFIPSYDGRNKEPITFPAKLPVLLAHGAEGIAVGMSTKILPHNLIELLEAEIKLLKNEPIEIYPDFQTGGTMDVSDYQDGNGKILVKAKIDTSDPKRVIVREIPFGTTTESLIASIENASRKGKFKVSQINDYTTDKCEIEIKLPRGVHAPELLDALYAFTDCQVSISPNLLVIKDDKPQIMTVTKVLEHNAQRLVEILTAELNIEKSQLNDKLHAMTLEQIFIEERIYKFIEEMKTSGAVKEAVYSGLEPFAPKIKRQVTYEDIERLLKIPIRRISLYDINKARKNMKDIRARLREIKSHLDTIVEYTIGFIEGLIEEYRDDYPRKTKIASIDKVDVREVAARDLKLRYDKETGYLGTSVSTGNIVQEVSPYDRVVIVKKDGTYSLIDVPEKQFIGKGMLYCDFVEPGRIFNAIYKQKKTNYAYIKRCKLEKFILNREYQLVPDDATLLKLSIEPDQAIVTNYKPKPRVRKLQEVFMVNDYPVRGNRAKGIRLSTKELSSAKFTKPEKVQELMEEKKTPGGLF